MWCMRSARMEMLDVLAESGGEHAEKSEAEKRSGGKRGVGEREDMKS